MQSSLPCLSLVPSSASSCCSQPSYSSCRRQRSQAPRNHRSEPPIGQVAWLWQDVHESDDDLDAGLGAQSRSPDCTSPQSSGDGRNSFLRRSRSSSNRARDPASSTRLVDAPRTSRDPSGPFGVAVADEGEDKVPSPRQRHIISPRNSPICLLISLWPLTSPSLTRRRASISIPYCYNPTQSLLIPPVVLGNHC